MDLELKGKVAIVGGSSEGIGYGIARLLAGEGASVAMVGRRAEPLQEAARRLSAETGSRTLAIPADIRKAADCERIVASAVKEFERLDVLVNNDGAPPLGYLSEFDDTAWEKAWQQNFMSVVRLSRAAIPHMQAVKGGRIVSITSLAALQPIPRFGLSVATWAGVLGYAKTLSLELAEEGITVNTICPGRFATNRLAKVFKTDGGTINLEELAKDIPMKRIGDVQEIAGLVGFLVSKSGAYTTGATFHVDGGRHGSIV